MLQDFKTGMIDLVIATSVLARGLDVPDIRLVINYDAPNHLEVRQLAGVSSRLESSASRQLTHTVGLRASSG